MKHLRLFLPLFILTSAVCGFAQDAVIYMTVHNLGCRQPNDTYTGYMPNLGFAEGDLVQVILTGPNGHIDPPLTDGQPGGDDQLAVNPGLPFAMNPVSFTHYPNTFYSPNAILIESTGNGPEPALHPGSKFYVRAWNGASPASSTTYYNSAQLTQDFPIGLESCGVDSAVRTIRPAYSFPSLITYAVVFDSGHPFNAPPGSPQVVIYFDSTQSKIFWQPVPTATSYRVEYSTDNSIWTTLGTTSDTLYVLPDDQSQNSLRLVRVFSVR
jgi:hypothetical protein